MVADTTYASEKIPSSSSSDSEEGGASGPFASEATTPLTPISPDSPLIEQNALGDAPVKKKKKKKPKKKAKANAKGKEQEPCEPCRPSVLCISRNKHWRYISSYHGPWLQLPLELLESLLMLNADPTTLSSETRMSQLIPPLVGSTIHTHTSNSNSSGNGKQRERLTLNPHDRDFTPPESPSTHITIPALPPASFPSPKPGKPSPPPIDPGAFRSVTSIRSYIDEAAELSVRASSGLSAAESGSMRNGASLNSPWAAAQSLGLNPLGKPHGGGRNVAMSAMRIHRLRALAVQKLAAAYKADEIASSVMVMQGGSVFDDVAERVLKVDPNDSDAKYVHFFHEKIPSRQLAESTTTKVLDELIAKHPQRLEYYRTRGVVHCFREEFSAATKDFTYALKEARAVRRAKMMHHNSNTQAESRPSKSKRRKNASGTKSNLNGQAPPSGTSAMDDDFASGSDGGNLLHPSVLPEAPEPIEPQCLFLRGAAYLQHAVHLIEGAVLGLEGVRKAPTIDGAELRLCYIENGKYGGVEIGNPEGPLGSPSGPKARAYNAVLGEKSFRDQITTLLKRSLRDHEKFLSHFDSLESPTATPSGDIASQVDYAYTLADTKRGSPDIPPVFTTYHPLLVESSYSALICQLMLADFGSLLPQFVRTAIVVDGLEGYPVFLPPRSMSQAEFLEILDRLAGGWRLGTRPHSLSAQRGKSRLALEGPPPLPYPAIPLSRSSSLAASLADDRPGSSSSSSPPKNSFAMGSSSMTFTNGRDSQTTPKPLANLSEDAPRCTSPLPSPISASTTATTRIDASHALDCARILLAPVVKRRQEKAERDRKDKLSGAKKKPAPISIPLHGPRVEVVLAWLSAVHLPELEE